MDVLELEPFTTPQYYSLITVKTEFPVILLKFYIIIIPLTPELKNLFTGAKFCLLFYWN